jgi:hypothetical protein
MRLTFDADGVQVTTVFTRKRVHWSDLTKVKLATNGYRITASFKRELTYCALLSFRTRRRRLFVDSRDMEEFRMCVGLAVRKALENAGQVVVELGSGSREEWASRLGVSLD